MSDQSNYSSRIVFSHIPIEFDQTGISAIRSADPENPILEPNTGVNRMIRRGDIASRHLGFGETGNSATRSADLENPTVEPNMKWMGRHLAEIWPFEISPIGYGPNERSVGRRSPVGPQFFLH